MLAPMVIGFFEYTFMRVRKEVDMKDLAELFNSYFHNDAARKEFSGLDSGICADSCLINAIAMQKNNEFEFPEMNKDICIGCGLCVSTCPNGSLTLARRHVLHLPPTNSNDKFIRIAQEKGKINAR